MEQGLFVANGMVFPRYLKYVNEQQNGARKPRWGFRALLRKLPQSVGKFQHTAQIAMKLCDLGELLFIVRLQVSCYTIKNG